MKAILRGTVLLYAVAALLLAARAPADAVTIGKLLGLAALFYAAYRYNLHAVTSGATGLPRLDFRVAVPLAAAFLILVNLTLRNLGGSVRDLAALALLAAAFFATREPVRKYGFALAWAAFNLWLFTAPRFSVILAPLFILAACYYRFSVTAFALGERYDHPRHGATREARRMLWRWTALALLLFAPLQLWGWWEESRLRSLNTPEQKRSAANLLDRSATGIPAHAGALGVAILLLLVYLWRHLREQRKGGKLNEELLALLSAQGFTRPLDEPPPRRYVFPDGPRGKVLQLYDKLLAGVEKKTGRTLRALTPRQREAWFGKLDAGRPWAELTAIFNRARYSDEEITAAEVAAVAEFQKPSGRRSVG